MVNLNAGQDPRRPADPCGKPAAYRAWITSCHRCGLYGFGECVGHPVCVPHGAAFRQAALIDVGSPAELVRLHGIGELPRERVPS